MRIFRVAILCFLYHFAPAQKGKQYELTSPDKRTKLTVQAGGELSWTVTQENTIVLQPSSIALQLSNGDVLGKDVQVKKATPSSANNTIQATLYKKATINDQYNQLLLQCKGDWGIIFRAYNDGVAYRFFTAKKDSITVQNETADFRFEKDHKSYFPYVREPRTPNDKFQTSFEALYDEVPISQFAKDTLAFLPVLIDLGGEKKAVIVEADLENYPGMYVKGGSLNTLSGVFAPYPLQVEIGGFNKLNQVVTRRAGYIAKVPGVQQFPWRAVIISSSDKELLNNDMVYKLASPNRVRDMGWIKPGKVAWDWWNNWNISGVDFKAGINTPTYKYYIDFAAANKIEYVVLDEGWSASNDLFNLSNAINLKEIVDYGKSKGVDIILWATWHAVAAQMDKAFPHYAALGVKGFKIDFLDRDDQLMVASTYDIAKKAAEHHLLLDYHGMFKPAGLQRTYPNVVNFEGVRGMENVKWAPSDDVPRYDVTIPFIRMIAGPMDYTPGAMRNAVKANFRTSNSMPMSQGTRVHQLAMYVIFEAPLQMLADNPTAYKKEQESTDFVAKVPTVFDETVSLDGKVGEYVALARRKGDTWFVGAMTNWTGRDLTLDFSFLGEGNYEAEIFRDGVNADRDATDYKKEVVRVTKNDKRKITLAPGGGWAARIYKVN